MKRNQAYRRHQTEKAIKHKRNIVLNVYGYTEQERNRNKFFIDGRLDKGKVHCSCPTCSPKHWGEKSKYKKIKQNQDLI